MGALQSSVRWATATGIGPGSAGGFRIVEVASDRAVFEIDRTLGLIPLISVLPIFGPRDTNSVPGLRLRESECGGVTIFSDDLEASIRISNTPFGELHQAARERLGQSHAKNLIALASSSSPKPQKRTERKTTALISLAMRSLSAVMPEVGGSSRMWPYPTKTDELAVEIHLATDVLAADEFISRFSSSLEGEPLALISHPHLRPPAHFPLSTGSGIIDLRLVPAAAWQDISDAPYNVPHADQTIS
ncbi:hypothetical protein [Microbacterium sp. NPDC079995]|uniref:hypothetical protein n=1 Tax=unclassified Microbacterium TaxID=2609290 RepID=UPI0034503023